jgi:hypothetical protein
MDIICSLFFVTAVAMKRAWRAKTEGCFGAADRRALGIFQSIRRF